MNKIRHILSLIALMLLLFSGCSIQKLDTQSSDTTKALISIACFDKGIKSRLSAAANIYLKEHPFVSFTIDAPDKEESNLSFIQKKLSGNNEPVLLTINGISDLDHLKDSLYDLSNTELANLAKYGLCENVSENGKVYGLPLCVEGLGLIYNREIFSAAKINADKINSFESLEKAVKKLDKKIKDGTLKERFPNLEAVFTPFEKSEISDLLELSLNESKAYKNARSLYKANYINISHEGIMPFLAKLQIKYAIGIKEDYKTPEFCIANVLSAITFGSSRMISTLKEENSYSSSKLAFLPTIGDKIAVGAPAYWAVNANAPKSQIDAAINFLNWLYTSEDGKIVSTDTLLFVPAYSGYKNIAPSEALNASVLDFIKRNKTVSFLLSGLPSEMTQDYLENKFIKSINGKISWKDAINDIKSDFARIKTK